MPKDIDYFAIATELTAYIMRDEDGDTLHPAYALMLEEHGVPMDIIENDELPRLLLDEFQYRGGDDAFAEADAIKRVIESL